MRPPRELSKLEIIGLQTILAGVTLQAEQAVEHMNQIRSQLNMPEIALEMEMGRRGPGRPRGSASHSIGLLSAAEEPLTVVAETAGRQRQRSTVARNWAIVKASGLKKQKQGMPSLALVERATKLLIRRGQWPLNEDGAPPEGVNKPAEPTARRSATNKAATKNKTRNKKVWSAKDRAKISSNVTKSLRSDWDLIRRAGLKSSGRPTREMVQEAKRILDETIPQQSVGE